jgi:ferredoxin
MVLPRDTSVKVREIRMDEEVSRPQDTVLPSDVLRAMIRRSHNHVIMHKCICRSANDCQDFPHDLGCIFMGKGAANIPSSVGRMVSMEEALEHVDRCQEAGLVHIIGRNKIDSVWLNTGPKEELLTICHCCPCCCLWKMLPGLPKHMSGRMTAMPGAALNINLELCVGCGDCVESHCCFVDAMSMQDGKLLIDASVCRVCGRCVTVCPHDVITLALGSDSVQAAVNRVEPLVDVSQA